MKSYSQYGEDIYILRAVESIPGGRLLDLGAWHPTQLSNSRALLEAGWKGILVECSPGPMQALVRGYHGWENVQVLGAAVGFDRHMIKMHATDDAVSTSDEANHEKWKEVGGYYGEFWAAQIRIQDIAVQFGGGFDFINFDTEGTSVPLFIQALELNWRPKCVCVEHDDRIVEVTQHAETAGYRVVHLNGTNIIFSR
jgi:FkbM family methyltransferase